MIDEIVKGLLMQKLTGARPKRARVLGANRPSLNHGDLVIRTTFAGQRIGYAVYVTAIGGSGQVYLSDGTTEHSRNLELLQPFNEGIGGVL